MSEQLGERIDSHFYSNVRVYIASGVEVDFINYR